MLNHHLTVLEVAIMLDLDPSTIRRISGSDPVRAGELRTRRDPGNGYRLYELHDVEAFETTDHYRTLRARADDHRSRRHKLHR